MPITETRWLVVDVPERSRSEQVGVVVMTGEELPLLPTVWEGKHITVPTTERFDGTVYRHIPSELSELVRLGAEGLVLTARGADVEQNAREYVALLAELLRQTAALREKTLPAIKIIVEA